jgi:hypothetical protein
MGAGSSHLPGPGANPLSVLPQGGGSGAGNGTLIAPGIDAVRERARHDPRLR